MYFPMRQQEDHYEIPMYCKIGHTHSREEEVLYSSYFSWIQKCILLLYSCTVVMPTLVLGALIVSRFMWLSKSVLLFGKDLGLDNFVPFITPGFYSNAGEGTVLWKQGERVISAGPIQVRKDERLKLVEHNSLRITDVDVSDSGNYTCEIEWIGTPIAITHKLIVLVPPSIVAVLPGGLGKVDRPIEAREGSQVRLECRAEGIPPPIVRWRTPVSRKHHPDFITVLLG